MGLIEARAYIHRIKCEKKKAYAQDYLHELQWGTEVDESKYRDLTYMAKQGVRMQLDECYL